jgi:hypothetical protein
MPLLPDPAPESPEDRLRELARVFARGVAQLHRRPPPGAPEKPSKSLKNGLESGPETRLSVHDG